MADSSMPPPYHRVGAPFSLHLLLEATEPVNHRPPFLCSLSLIPLSLVLETLAGMLSTQVLVVLGGIRRHPVGKRTPCILVECFYDSNNKDAFVSPNQEVSRVEVAVQRALSGPQNVDSPQVSGSSNRGTYNIMVSHVLPSDKKNVGSDVANTNCMDVGMYVNYSSGSLGKREVGDKGSPSDSRQSNSEGYGRNEHKWNVKFQKERHTCTGGEFNQNLDAMEACSGFVEEEGWFTVDEKSHIAYVKVEVMEGADMKPSDMNGKVREKFPLEMAEIQGPVVAADIYDDDKIEMVTADTYGNVDAWTAQGEAIWEVHLKSFVP